jgi:hypothetical protein
MGSLDMRRCLVCLLILLALVPSSARAEEYFLGNLELGASAPLAGPNPGLGWGGTFSGAVMVSFERWLIPSLRVGAITLASGSLTPEQDIPTASRNGELATVFSGALRLRPRGLAHPNEPSAAGCVWGEVGIGVAIGFSGDPQLALEGAIGFLFDLGDTDFGPVVRVLHAWNEQAEHLIFSFGVEVVLGDTARERGAPTHSPE